MFLTPVTHTVIERQVINTHSSQRMYNDAMRDFNLNTAKQPDLAYDKPYILKYNSQHPDLLIIGDSIFDGWSGYILQQFPNAIIDAKVSRQFARSIPIYKWLLRYTGVQSISTIVLELGTNGEVTKDQINSFMQLAGSARNVFLIVPSVPRPWQNEVKNVDYWAANKYPNIHLVNWYQAAMNHPQYFWADQVHPNWLGIQKLTLLVKKSLAQNYNPE